MGRATRNGSTGVDSGEEGSEWQAGNNEPIRPTTLLVAGRPKSVDLTFTEGYRREEGDALSFEILMPKEKSPALNVGQSAGIGRERNILLARYEGQRSEKVDMYAVLAAPVTLPPSLEAGWASNR